MKLDWELRGVDCMGDGGLETVADNSVDALVTDPPAGIGFMGKDWDSDKGGRVSWVAWFESVARECLRVMKPGAHGVVWALPRTSHWTATALEQAGFEVRDVITHHFGTGFPKSLNVSKAIDEAAGAEREIVGTKKNNKGDSGGQTYAALGEFKQSKTSDVTAAATEAAKQWDGWGTALKPATEHWVLVRKPLAGTVAANVQEHGTGALNIDATRIGYADKADQDQARVPQPTFGTTTDNVLDFAAGVGRNGETFDPSKGRWPANLVLSHSEWCEDGGACLPGCPVALLNAQSGPAQSGAMKQSTIRRGTNEVYGKFTPGTSATVRAIEASEGGASRFFYTSKPTTAERERDLGLHVRRAAADLVDREAGSDGLKSPRAGAGRTSRGRANIHPTVKSLDLMSWLIKLVTSPGGIVMDPFTGSGSTGVAARHLGFRFLGWEADPEYFEIAKARIASAVNGPLFAGVGSP